MHQFYEVLFSGDFTPKHPWGELPDEEEWSTLNLTYPESFKGSDGTTSIPIFELTHITHNKQAESISSTLSKGYYTFVPKAKVGKANQMDGTPIGDTYRCEGQDSYRSIPRSEGSPVFPGFLSWWGIDVREWYKKDSKGRRFLHCVEEERRSGNYVPGYLKEETRSHYGNNAFSIRFNTALDAYKKARSDKKDNKVQMKVGGTLRYDKEICYVVIIGMEDDRELQSMPNVGDHKHCRPFRHNGLVDKKGFVVDETKIPEFKASWIVHSMADGEDRGEKSKFINFSWEQLVFAFYLPQPSQKLTCPKEAITRSKVDHNFCTSTTPDTHGNGKWVCPNLLYSRGH